jgi:hypothetical protein
MLFIHDGSPWVVKRTTPREDHGVILTSYGENVARASWFRCFELPYRSEFAFTPLTT